jgi:glycosyltransferase involved in cell wall biosynthesis
VVPFGASAPPVLDPAPVRDAIGARPGDPVLFFGGLYDWHDLSALYAVWPGLLRDFPGLSIVFSENPNRDQTPQKVFESAVAESERQGWKGRSFHFLPWMPYERRGALYGAATAAIALCRPGLETELSFRTRLLDAAAAGLPSVSIHGGGLARRLAEAGAGWTAADAAELRRVLETVLRDGEARNRAAERARRFAEDLAWPRVAAPLAEFFANPRISSRLPFPEARPRPAFRLLRRGRS